ncbi:MAG: DUF4907 domain-containing protein [Saprospiraceae bacterium]|nr:DUF4907 domain-containing protein [Saprospiraceae bacterium]
MMANHNLLIYFLFTPILWALGWHSCNETRSEIESTSILSTADTTYQIIPAIDGTYGYEILIDGKAMIRQLQIPSLPGVRGFVMEEDAVKVAKLVLGKISAGVMPPSVEKHELDDLEIKY